jgi:hypothetical protein
METKLLLLNHGELKRKMLEASIKKQQSVIDDFKQGIKEKLTSEGIVNEEEMDLSQQEFNTEMVQGSNNIADQLQFANEEMKLLYDMAPTIQNIHNTVQPGSVVVTDKETFFVSASIEQFEVDNLQIFGISTQSPLYKAMEGEQKDDTFTYKTNTYSIVDIF